MSTVYSVEIVKQGITAEWWFQITIAVLTATFASILTYRYSRKVAKQAELNRIINEIYSQVRIYGDSLLNFMDYHKRVKSGKVMLSNAQESEKQEILDNMRQDSATEVKYKDRYEDARAAFIVGTVLLNSLLAKRLSGTDYGKYVTTFLGLGSSASVKRYIDKRSIMEKKLNNEAEHLHKLLTSLHYEINNNRLYVSWNRFTAIFKQAKLTRKKKRGEIYE